MRLLSPAAMLVMATLLLGCGSKSEPVAEEDVLVAVGDSVLTRQAVISRIPEGIAAEDSAALFLSIANRWVERMVLSEMAREKLPALPEIDRMVEEYRSSLIVAEYLRMMSEENSRKTGFQFSASPGEVTEAEIKNFYESNRADLVNEVPLVKGIYLKVPEGSDNLADIRRCLRGASEQDIDELERRWSVQAVRYDYFADDWVDWTTVTENIPYRFGDASVFLKDNRDFETVYNGSLHMLHIMEWLPAGSVLPYEYARPRIASLLERSETATYREALVKSLIKKAMGEGRLRGVTYDPLLHRNIEYSDTLRHNNI